MTACAMKRKTDKRLAWKRETTMDCNTYTETCFHHEWWLKQPRPEGANHVLLPIVDHFHNIFFLDPDIFVQL